MTHSLYDLAERLGAKALDSEDRTVTGFATDSAAVRPGDLFLAIRGSRVDGHDFVQHAIETGAVAAVVERSGTGPRLEVPNLVQALARMARTFRAEFHGPVIAVTGSAGKTTTKEFLASAVAPLGPVLKSAGNRNTEYSAPLTWAESTPAHRVAVVELAMRGLGQIEHLAKFSQPTIGIITNIGYSHLEQVGSREGILKAKSELFHALPQDGVAIYWEEDDYADALAKQGPARKRTFGFSTAAECQVTSYRLIDEFSCYISGRLDGQQWEARLPFIGRHLALNAAAAVLAAQTAGVDAGEAALLIQGAKLPPMRMEMRQWKGLRVLLDAYNASPASMRSAIEALMELPGGGQRVAVVGEMRELGSYEQEAHRAIGEFLVTQGVPRAIFIGPAMKDAHDAALAAGADWLDYQFAQSIDEVRAFLDSLQSGTTVLIKGSRSLELEKVLDPTGGPHG